jgi:hypothetical protein
MKCQACKERVKDWNGSDSECAFKSTIFSSDNWNCATMNALRRIVEDAGICNEDQYAVLLPVFECGEFLVLSWYKHRGATEGAFILYEDKVSALTIEEAEAILVQYRSGKYEGGHSRPTSCTTGTATSAEPPSLDRPA